MNINELSQEHQEVARDARELVRACIAGRAIEDCIDISIKDQD